MRRPSKLALLLIAFACSASLRAQTASSPANVLPAPAAPTFLPGYGQSQTQYPGSVFGHVYCADTNAPARFARVALIPVNPEGHDGRGGTQQVSTALDGSFQIQNVAPGSYYVVAMLSGYLNPLSQVAFADVTSSDAAAQARVAKVVTPVVVNGSDGAHAEIRLERGGSISGTVYYDDGSPAVNVIITAKLATGNTATTSNTPPSAGALGQQQFARTDDYGRYRVPGLPPGDYLVMASSQLGEPGGFARGQQSTTLTIYAPKSFRSVDAKTFTLKASNEVSGADVLIPLLAFHTVSGTVESSDGHTLNAGSLMLIDDKDKTHSFRSNIGNDGQYHFLYVPEGSYTLSLSGGAVTEQSTTAGNNRGRNRTTVVQSYGTATQSVLVENGDLSVTVQAPPLAPAAASATP
jgi:hypothetical protein